MKETKSNTISFLLIILIASSMLIVINFYTIKTLSATRAYVNGESHYSKGQNIATRNLINYLFTSEKIYFLKFKKYLSIPLGDYKARIALLNHSDKETIKQAFREGMNAEEDLEDMIWLFQNFHNLSFFKAAIDEWEGGDILNLELCQIGIDLESKMVRNELDFRSKVELLHRLDVINNEIAVKEDNFSNFMGEGTRTVKYYLLLTNIFFICIIISSISYYYSSVVKKVTISKQELNQQKRQLKSIIKDLKKTKENLSTQIIQHKKIIGTISHDIRSPLKYIQIIAKRLSETIDEKLDETSHKHAVSMFKSSTQPYNFTSNLVEYSYIYIEEQDSRQSTSYSISDIIEAKKNIYDEIAKSNKTIILNQCDVNLTTQINSKIISIILHNLLDNAVKFTEKGTIKIGARAEKQKIIFWVSDTGFGMQQDVLEYYTNLSYNQDPEKLILSTYGIGLHLVHELLNILKGKIAFNSILNLGTTITIEVPLIENQ